MPSSTFRNPHPGEILKHEFLAEFGMSQNRIAKTIGVPGNRIHAIVGGSRDITADTDLRLCRSFGLSEGYFLRLQNAHDTLEAKRRLGGPAWPHQALEAARRGVRRARGCGTNAPAGQQVPTHDMFDMPCPACHPRP